jgi:hypothetical protein
MRTLLTIFAVVFLSLTCVRAEDDSPAIELKHKSSFTTEASGRNPFWPIGWKPAAKVSTTEHAGPEIQPAAFVVSSITLDHGAHFAIINGKAMQEGQTFGLQLGNQTYQLTVKTIEDGRVILARRDQEIIVPLRRK